MNIALTFTVLVQLQQCNYGLAYPCKEENPLERDCLCGQSEDPGLDICSEVKDGGIIPLNSEEEKQEVPFYTGQLVDEIICLCFDYTTKKYNWEDPDCIANSVDLSKPGQPQTPENIQKTKAREERLRKERRDHLCDAVSKVISFKRRLENPAETVAQFILFFLALICGIYLTVVGHFRFVTIVDPRHPDPTKGWPYWVYQNMIYYVVPVGQESVHKEITDSERIALETAKEREVEIDDVLDSDEEKDDVYQTAAAVTDYSDFWNLWQHDHEKQPS